MPIYSYKCTKCKYSKDMLLKWTEAHSKLKCPECKKESFYRETCTPRSFKFKGPGFYETDYKGK